MIASELGKTVEDISHWPLATLRQWMAFFQVRDEEIKKAYDRNKTRGR